MVFRFLSVVFFLGLVGGQDIQAQTLMGDAMRPLGVGISERLVTSAIYPRIPISCHSTVDNKTEPTDRGYLVGVDYVFNLRDQTVSFSAENGVTTSAQGVWTNGVGVKFNILDRKIHFSLTTLKGKQEFELPQELLENKPSALVAFNDEGHYDKLKCEQDVRHLQLSSISQRKSSGLGETTNKEKILFESLNLPGKSKKFGRFANNISKSWVSSDGRIKFRTEYLPYVNLNGTDGDITTERTFSIAYLVFDIRIGAFIDDSPLAPGVLLSIFDKTRGNPDFSVKGNPFRLARTVFNTPTDVAAIKKIIGSDSKEFSIEDGYDKSPVWLKFDCSSNNTLCEVTIRNDPLPLIKEAQTR